MTTSFEQPGPSTMSPFPRAVQLSARDTGVLFSVLDKAARAVAHTAGDAALGARVAGAGAAFRGRVEAGSVAVEAVLDLAAELLETVDVLLAGGQELEALALEGVSGRLTELLVGAGQLEGTPLGGWR